MSETRARPRLPWADEQRRLGVGVRIERRPRRHLAHAAGLAEHARLLAHGALEPVDDELAARIERLRLRLWRSPFWTARLRALGGSPDDLRSLADLAALPPLGRDQLAAGWQDAFDADGDPGLHVATTSGSTGQAALVVRSAYDGLHMWAVVQFWVDRLAVALPPRPRLVLLCTLPGGLEYSVRAPQFHDGALHRLSTLRADPERRLIRARPAILSSDPAGLAWLRDRDTTISPALVLSSAQELPAALRAETSARFGAPVVNYYALTEVGPIAWECLEVAGRFHVLHPDVAVESEAGELVVTRLRDSPAPILRYRTGDRGEVDEGACPCGVRGPRIHGLRGRHPALFLLPDGREVDAWALSWLFKDLPLVRFELVQHGPESFALTVDPSIAMPLDLLAERLERALRRMGFPAPTVAIARAELPLPAKPCPFRRA